MSFRRILIFWPFSHQTLEKCAHLSCTVCLSVRSSGRGTVARLSSSQRCCRNCDSLGKWACSVVSVSPDVSTESTACIFRVKRTVRIAWDWKCRHNDPTKRRELLAQRHSVTAQRTKILRLGSLCPRHGSNYKGSRSIHPLVLDVGTGWKWVVDFTLQPIYPAERNLDIPRIGQSLRHHCYIQTVTGYQTQGLTKSLSYYAKNTHGEQPSSDTCVTCWSVPRLRG